jgi:hypothetical protein
VVIKLSVGHSIGGVARVPSRGVPLIIGVTGVKGRAAGSGAGGRPGLDPLEDNSATHAGDGLWRWCHAL